MNYILDACAFIAYINDEDGVFFSYYSLLSRSYQLQ